MSAYREAPPARPIESPWARRARQARRVARWPLDHVRMWHVFAALTLGPIAVLITCHGVWRQAAAIGLGLILGTAATLAALYVLVCVGENWKRPISKWRWPS